MTGRIKDAASSSMISIRRIADSCTGAIAAA
jgi:hypothetical protein